MQRRYIFSGEMYWQQHLPRICLWNSNVSGKVYSNYPAEEVPQFPSCSLYVASHRRRRMLVEPETFVHARRTGLHDGAKENWCLRPNLDPMSGFRRGTHGLVQRVSPHRNISPLWSYPIASLFLLFSSFVLLFSSEAISLLSELWNQDCST